MSKTHLDIQFVGTDKSIKDKLIDCAAKLREKGYPSSFRFDENPPESEKVLSPTLYWNGKDFSLSFPDGKTTRFSEPDWNRILSILQEH